MPIRTKFMATLSRLALSPGASATPGSRKSWAAGFSALWNRDFLAVGVLLLSLPLVGATVQSVPDKLVVLTFDDAVKSHRTFVAPLLKELGFGATFFVTHKWMDDRTNFMTWEEIGEIHQMGFEIGNHSWTHDDFSQPKR